MKNVKVLKFWQVNALEQYALIEYETGFWRWKKKKQAEVFTSGLFWRWTSNGDPCPGLIVDNAISAHKAKCALDQIKCNSITIQ